MPIDHEIEAGILKVSLHGQVTTGEFAGYLAAIAELRDLPRLVLLSD
jgi:hypothetical protein